MDKQKQIEEMAMFLYNQQKWCDMTNPYEVAKLLINNGYRKMTESEFQKYCAYKIIETQIRGCLDRERELQKQVNELKEKLWESKQDMMTYHSKTVAEAVKDTAKEIAKEIDNLTFCIIAVSNQFEKGYFQAITDMKTAVKYLLKEKYA